jgi:O-antigen/teichoic acid export membrane protein
MFAQPKFVRDPLMPMTGEEVKRRIWSNTVSNYICMALRLVLGVFMFRLLVQMLPTEEFGFWVFLWGVFGFGVLLDFGFGFTAQKRVAELSVHQNWTELSKVLSTIFFTYVGLGLAIMVVGVWSSHLLVSMFQITPANQEPFRDLFVYFFFGMGLAFPLGIFPEILRGLQRISLVNYILLGGMIINFVFAALILYNGWGLKPLFITALLCTFVPDLVCGFFAMRLLPGVRIRPQYFSRTMIRKTVSFSLYAYIITVSNMVLIRSDHLVIGAALAMSAVSIYGMGAKVAEMFLAFTHQLPETLSPAAAHHHAKGERGHLQDLLVNGTRFSLMLATPMYCICVLFMEGILRVLLNDPNPSSEIYWIAQILLLWVYMMVITQSVTKRVFIMCGHERKLMWLAVGEAVLNLSLSLALILYFQAVWGVALASLIATSTFGWLFLWPWAAREADLSGWKLARTVLVPTWTGTVPLLVLALLWWMIPWLQFPHSIPVLMIQGMIAVLVAALGVWRLGLSAEEREKLGGLLMGRFLKREAA